jgi:ParB family chromosome partitioning protein
MQPKKEKDVLGKGIRSLLQNIDAELKNTSGQLKTEVAEKTTATLFLSLDQIDINPNQPRKDFNEIALKELADSIKIHGIVQPLTVSLLPNGRYKLIAGERRYRASKIAGLKEVPVYVRQANDQYILELALLENLQRENLNPVEIALSYKRLMDDLEYTQEQLAERMGKDRSTVANFIRILKLPPDIQVAVRSGKISRGHAVALLGVEEVDKQLVIFAEIIKKGLSVRQTEELVAKFKGTAKLAKKQPATTTPDTFKKIEDKIASQFGTKVKLQHNKKGYGTVSFEYYSIDELNGLLQKLNVNIG